MIVNKCILFFFGNNDNKEMLACVCRIYLVWSFINSLFQQQKQKKRIKKSIYSASIMISVYKCTNVTWCSSSITLSFTVMMKLMIIMIMQYNVIFSMLQNQTTKILTTITSTFCTDDDFDSLLLSFSFHIFLCLWK